MLADFGTALKEHFNRSRNLRGNRRAETAVFFISQTRSDNFGVGDHSASVEGSRHHFESADSDKCILTSQQTCCGFIRPHHQSPSRVWDV